MISGWSRGGDDAAIECTVASNGSAAVSVSVSISMAASVSTAVFVDVSVSVHTCEFNWKIVCCIRVRVCVVFVNSSAHISQRNASRIAWPVPAPLRQCVHTLRDSCHACVCVCVYLLHAAAIANYTHTPPIFIFTFLCILQNSININLI